jgi:predicted GNAT family acetyltransferase
MADVISVSHDPSAGVFEIRTDEGTALLRYAHQDGKLNLLHTEVPEALEGRGYGAALAKAALDYAESLGMKIIPTCPFVRKYIERHPERAALVATR